MRCDVAVIGLGGIGSAIAAHCASRGAAVIGVEQFDRAHGLGSSSGRTRLIRKAYFEAPDYVPLLHRAYELWHDLELAAGEQLLHKTGLLSVGGEESRILRGTVQAAREHNLLVELLTAADVRARFPTLLVHDHEVGVLECDGGVLLPERAIAAQLQIAEAHGAQLLFHTAMRNWRRRGDAFEVELNDGSTIHASALVLALGPWFRDVLESLGVPIRVQRNVQTWFTPATGDYDASRFPGFLLDRPEFPSALYGFPNFGDGVKAAFHGYGSITTAQELDREVDYGRDVAPVAQALDSWMPRAAHTFREAKPCLYTLTPDEHFVIDQHPEHARLIICGGFSGHGFKFAPVVGEIAADLALDGGTRHPIGFLSLRRKF
jgi:sarcosine oxidase